MVTSNSRVELVRLADGRLVLVRECVMNDKLSFSDIDRDHRRW